MSTNEIIDYDEPCFVISVAARILGVRTQTLRYYESLGLVEPHRSMGNQRVFSRKDVDRIRRVRSLIEDLGVNLAGVEVMIKLLDQLQRCEVEINRLKHENSRLREIINARV